MTRTEKIQQLNTLPWQALYDFAIKKNINKDDIKSKDKSEIINQLLCIELEDEEIEKVIKDYIYGSRVTFTLWRFSDTLARDDYEFLKALKDYCERDIDIKGFQNINIVSVNEYDDRLELLYTYSKKYSYVNEDGKNDSVWELHQGCIWIGINKNYVACISKHEKIMIYLVQLIASKLSRRVQQIKPPKSAIDKCTNQIAVSRIVLQGVDGEKTTVSNSRGFTQEQEQEVARIRKGRYDTSGSYIAEIAERLTATVKYNISKGNIGIYKHLPADVLFKWSQNAIEVIMDEIEQMKRKPAEEIYAEMGCDIKWTGVSKTNYKPLNWILTQVINSFDFDTEFCVQLSNTELGVLDEEKLFIKIPQVYCEECSSYEIPYCWNCGETLTYNRKGELECSCDAPLRYTCSERHMSCQLKNWYLPSPLLKNMIDKNIKKIYDVDLDYQICIMDDQMCISNYTDTCGDEIKMFEIECFKTDATYDEETRSYAVRMNEKCDGTCSYEKIEKCIRDSTMDCLPKLFYSIIPDFIPSPHSGCEYGDVSGQIKVGMRSYEMIAIIKKNTENKKSKTSETKPDSKFVEKRLMATSNEGQEIIRQFVYQGMKDDRVQVVAVVTPQYIERGLKGTLTYLARISNKKVVFIELDQVCQLLAKRKEEIKFNLDENDYER